MAAPRHRRRGFSRRVQYGLFAGYVIAIAGILLGVALLLVSRLDPRAFGTLRGVVVDAGALFTGIGRAGVEGIHGMGDAIDAYLAAGSQNRELRKELAHERRAVIAAKVIAAENARLKKLVRLTENLPAPILSTRLIGSTPTGQRRFATLSAGTAGKVRPGMTVRSPEGLVGRVYESGIFASRVLLLTDGETAVPVKITRSGLAAIATGQGDGTMEVRALIAGGRPFRRGDLVVTSGTGGVYTPNIPVAVVTAVRGDRAVARPLADPARADFAAVYPIAQAPITDLPAQPKP
ncbi:rod shape-determining protein MreC [Rhizorhabdus dicambivorans]|uniref:Cell shape-determining protein MreC n=1 Tax=Rhizorhabdus dicambivorans TaxID=1850238 RepID=A0A2A4FPM5_9SPHN|nr:rod shape-determining protein MreC [Rhizorhabdus dicambivorans]ATE65263.1 rod shape-determining protein MreC [Rhizorhabdus dicambivorans]PCE39664.1 rod shape-determining protein MreC [Rhizorhabdus dicambivorans]